MKLWICGETGVARNEVDARISDTQGRIESGLNRAFDNAVWYRKDKEPNFLSHSELNSLASDLADERFRVGTQVE